MKVGSINLLSTQASKISFLMIERDAFPANLIFSFLQNSFNFFYLINLLSLEMYSK